MSNLIQRAYYSAPGTKFVHEQPSAILGQLVAHHTFDVDLNQRSAWQFEITHLQKLFQALPKAHVFLEFVVPRMGKRADAVRYRENESGASLKRPELFRLLEECRTGDILLVEQVDRLSRLTAEDWTRLKALLGQRKVRVVALDLPTSWMMAIDRIDEFTSRMFEAVNGMMLDVLAAVARKDYEDRRRRQREGIDKAKARGAYRGRPEDVARNQAILKLLKQGNSWSTVMASTGAARATIAKIAKRLQAG